MKFILKLFIFSAAAITFSAANAYPSCSGTAVSACSGLSQSACGTAYIKPVTYSGCTSCSSNGDCNQQKGMSGNVSCTRPGIQCKWSGSSCSDGGAQCQ